jgi:hypothetical protein
VGGIGLCGLWRRWLPSGWLGRFLISIRLLGFGAWRTNAAKAPSPAAMRVGARDDDGRQIPFRAALFPAVGGNLDVAVGGGSGRGSGVDTGVFPDVNTRAQSADEARVAEGGLSVAAGGRGVRRLRGRRQRWGWGWVSVFPVVMDGDWVRQGRKSAWAIGWICRCECVRSSEPVRKQVERFRQSRRRAGIVSPREAYVQSGVKTAGWARRLPHVVSAAFRQQPEEPDRMWKLKGAGSPRN